MENTITLQDKYWLAGLLEGEGCFLKIKGTSCIAIALEMKDEDIMKKASSIMFNTKVYKISKRKENWSDTYKLSLRGSKAKKIMEELLPLMGIRRTSKIKECLNYYKVQLKGKLYDEQKIEIFNRKNENVIQLAKEFNITKWRVYQIWRGEYKILGV